jgi:hypothetical protein
MFFAYRRCCELQDQLGLLELWVLSSLGVDGKIIFLVLSSSGGGRTLRAVRIP